MSKKRKNLSASKETGFLSLPISYNSLDRNRQQNLVLKAQKQGAHFSSVNLANVVHMVPKVGILDPLSLGMFLENWISNLKRDIPEVGQRLSIIIAQNHAFAKILDWGLGIDTHDKNSALHLGIHYDVLTQEFRLPSDPLNSTQRIDPYKSMPIGISLPETEPQRFEISVMGKYHSTLTFYGYYQSLVHCAISIPLAALLKGYPSVNNLTQCYTHTIQTEGHDFIYCGITSRTWIKRLTEHLNSIRSGEGQRFHRKVNELLSTDTQILFSTKLVEAGVSREIAEQWEQKSIRKFADDGICLNVIHNEIDFWPKHIAEKLKTSSAKCAHIRRGHYRHYKSGKFVWIDEMTIHPE
jgi:hypothetical protein